MDEMTRSYLCFKKSPLLCESCEAIVVRRWEMGSGWNQAVAVG